jgi:hypothetical protein
MLIQFSDEFGKTGKPFVYEDQIWCEGQLSDREEDIIEHLDVGEIADLDHGWKVERLPDRPLVGERG